MSLPLETIVFFAVLSFLASVVTGGLGYGYSSLSIPLAILVLSNRVVNPAYVLAEASLNTCMLAIAGRGHMREAFRRSAPIIVGLLPGVLVGSLALSSVAPEWVRLTVYVVLLPLILLQLAGIRRPIKKDRTAGVPLGLGVGTLYSLTTISGPPIALFFNNQGLKREDFRATITQVRVAESYMTAVSYYFLRLYTPTSSGLFFTIAPPIVLGLPLGVVLLKRVSIETFRRLAMGFDGLIVTYGLRAAVISVSAVPQVIPNAIFVAGAAAVVYLFVRYVRGSRTAGAGGGGISGMESVRGPARELGGPDGVGSNIGDTRERSYTPPEVRSRQGEVPCQVAFSRN